MWSTRSPPGCGPGRRSWPSRRARRGALAYGEFRPAMFQAAVDAGRPVQPLRLTYHHRDGAPSTVAAFVGDDTCGSPVRRIVRARLTVVHVEVASLELPGTDRRDLAARCAQAVRPDHPGVPHIAPLPLGRASA